MSVVADNIQAFVVRLVTPPGAVFPVQEYYTFAEEWSRDRKDAKPLLYEVADKLARKLTGEVHVYPVVLAKVEADAIERRQRRDLAADWHAGKPNCGVD